ncbi:MAG: hypothetical protein U1F60_03770 [Planctomycetota bacterium]
MTVLQITCDNCGAKYKLPESFTGAQAKCQKCHSIIDVAKQRAAAQAGAGEAAKPAAAAKPASAAKPAVDRSKVGKPAEPAMRTSGGHSTKPPAGKTAGKPAAKSAPGRGRAAASDDEGDGHPKVTAPKKNSTMPVLLAGLALLVVAGVLLIVKMSGGKAKPEPTKESVAKAPETNKPPEADKPTDKPADPTPATAPGAGSEKPKVEGAKPTDAAAKETEKPADTPAEKPAETPAPAAPAGPAANEVVTPAGQTVRITSPPATMAEVTDPKTYPEVTWPASIDDATKTEVRELAETAATDTGIQGTRASNKLREKGHPAVFAIVERLRTIDYKDVEASQGANLLNKTLEDMTNRVLSAGYIQIPPGFEMTPGLAELNSRSAKKWIDALAKLQTPADLKKIVDSRKPTPDDDK